MIVTEINEAISDLTLDFGLIVLFAVMFYALNYARYECKKIKLLCLYIGIVDPHGERLDPNVVITERHKKKHAQSRILYTLILIFYIGVVVYIFLIDMNYITTNHGYLIIYLFVLTVMSDLLCDLLENNLKYGYCVNINLEKYEFNVRYLSDITKKVSVSTFLIVLCSVPFAFAHFILSITNNIENYKPLLVLISRILAIIVYAVHLIVIKKKDWLRPDPDETKNAIRLQQTD